MELKCEPMYATVQKKQHRNGGISSTISIPAKLKVTAEMAIIRPEINGERPTPSKHKNDRVEIDAKTKHKSRKVSKEKKSADSDEHKNKGTYFAIVRQKEDLIPAASNGENSHGRQRTVDAHTNGHSPKSNRISFLNMSQISEIYQSQRKHPPHNASENGNRNQIENSQDIARQMEYLRMNSTRAKESNADINGDDPFAFQQRLRESKRMLGQVRKSFDSRASTSPSDTSPSNGGSGSIPDHRRNTIGHPRIGNVSSLHQALEKQSSNASGVSNASISSSLSQKLLTLSEDDKSIVQSPQTEKRSIKLKTLNNRIDRRNEEPDGAITIMEAKNRSSEKRVQGKKGLPIQYTFDDFSSIENHRNNTNVVERYVPRDTSAGKRSKKKVSRIKYTTTDISSPILDRNKHNDAEDRSSHRRISPIDGSRRSKRQSTIQYTADDIWSPVSKNQGQASRTPQESPTSGNTGSEVLSIGDEYTNFKRSSSKTTNSRSTDENRIPPPLTNPWDEDPTKLIFKVDLDEPYPGRKENEEDLVLFREHGIYIPINPRSISTSKRQHNKGLNKWIQTDGPPIRPPKSRSLQTQTGINPCTFSSKRLQMRPWNIPNYLMSSYAQTNHKLESVATQTQETRRQTQGCQTRVRTYQDSVAQTKPLPDMRESSVQAVDNMKTIETQTPDEDSEIWGDGASISLDRLIRDGALKRSQSIGHGITAETEECGRGRSSSMDVLRKESGSCTTPQDMPSGSKITGKIGTYSWSENGKFVKIFVSYSGVHLIPGKNIKVTTNGINLSLTIKEETNSKNVSSEEEATTGSEAAELQATTSTLNLNRLRRPVASLSYTIQRDMITIILRKTKLVEWKTLLFPT